jgi:hypothetical protein
MSDWLQERIPGEEDSMWESLGWIVAALAFCSLWAVQSWVTNRRQEREAFYRSEAIKKIAEMQGATSEPVLALLREALASPASPPHPMVMTSEYRKEREAFYRSEALKKISEAQGGGPEAALQWMREEDRRYERRTRSGLRLGGLILCGVGIGATIFLYVLLPDMPVYLAGLIPTLIGVALLTYSYIVVDNSARPPG